MRDNKENSRVKSAFELYGEKKKKEGEEESKKELYEKLLEKGYDEKSAHDLVYED